MNKQSWPLKRIVFWLGLSIVVVSGVVLIWINFLKPPNGLAIGLISVALLFVGVVVLIIAGILYWLDDGI
ncbi:hypothetical protein BKI52_32360 [marine bacterium AO1-C]|nr:hypothetical protein BKI52_32360 [marine bacterium AO1-C]